MLHHEGVLEGIDEVLLWLCCYHSDYSVFSKFGEDVRCEGIHTVGSNEQHA